MFDIGWTELVVVGCVAILVVGPKELPGMLRTFGKTVGNMRRMAGDFQRQFNDALKEAEIDELQKTVKFDPLEDARKSAEAFQESIKKQVDDVAEGAEIKMPELETAPAAKSTGKSASTKSRTTKAKSAKPAAGKSATARTAKSSTAKTSAANTSTTKTGAAKPKAGRAKPAAAKTAATKTAGAKTAGAATKSAPATTKRASARTRSTSAKS